MSTGPKRDSAFEDLLSAGVRSAARAAGNCPDAADLAAFVDGGLSAAERSALEEHAAGCDRCQHAIALMGALPPADAVAAARRERAVVPRLRWLVPATIAATVIVYIAVRPVIAPQYHPKGQSTAVARTGPPPAEVAAVQQPAAPPPAQLAPARAHPQARQNERASRTHLPDAARQKQLAAAAPPAESPRFAAGRVAESVYAPVPEAKPDQAARPKAEAAAPAAPVQAQLQAPVQSQGPGAVGGSPLRADGTQAQAKAAPAPPPSVRSIEVKGMAEAVTVLDAVDSKAKIVLAPGGTVRWRLDAGGRIARSSNGGATFEPVPYRASAELLAASAPSQASCWIVGRSGLVLLTSDGERWETRPFPERVDLVAIAARDTLHATVTARDGRKFITDDGGASWVPVR